MPTLTGVVTGGYGAAARDVNAGIYDRCGTLEPGTLNLHLTGSELADGMPPPALEIEYAGIVRRLWPANSRGRFVWVLHADHLGPVVELLADVHLRTTFELSDGDRLEVSL